MDLVPDEVTYDPAKREAYKEWVAEERGERRAAAEEAKAETAATVDADAGGEGGPVLAGTLKNPAQSVAEKARSVPFVDRSIHGVLPSQCLLKSTIEEIAYQNQKKFTNPSFRGRLSGGMVYPDGEKDEILERFGVADTGHARGLLWPVVCQWPCRLAAFSGAGVGHDGGRRGVAFLAAARGAARASVAKQRVQ